MVKGRKDNIYQFKIRYVLHSLIQLLGPIFQLVQLKIY